MAFLFTDPPGPASLPRIVNLKIFVHDIGQAIYSTLVKGVDSSFSPGSFYILAAHRPFNDLSAENCLNFPRSRWGKKFAECNRCCPRKILGISNGQVISIILHLHSLESKDCRNIGCCSSLRTVRLSSMTTFLFNVRDIKSFPLLKSSSLWQFSRYQVFWTRIHCRAFLPSTPW